MDLATENRLAAMLMKEAAELRRQSQEEGVLAYLRQPKARGRPNSRFLTATVLGVQQANRVVEVNDMWRAREKEMELNDKLTRKSKDYHPRSSQIDRATEISSSGTERRHPEIEENNAADEGLKDEEIEKFLHSRVKRGRGSVGSRMDEAGPYLLPSSSSKDGLSRSPDHVRKYRVLGPEKPSSLEDFEFSDEEEKKKRKKAKKSHSNSSDKKHCRRNEKKEKSRDKKKRRKEEKRRKPS
ncbi:uncharacterized protein [Rutidosis leptorrhynchoides]|uniref:uncharacterized protein n=1 Tax=Rutidosis leptorrhynchoides TaxID=125765 RepID=UPI003A98D384